jgi:predicted small lipoprotein YifL
MRIWMPSLVAIALVVLMVLVLSGCGGKGGGY